MSDIRDQATSDREAVGQDKRSESEGGRADRLENVANFSAPHSHKARIARWKTRAFLWEVSSLPRVRACGRWSIFPDRRVEPRSTGTTVGYAGLSTCGSVWACPTCNHRIQSVRRIELGVIIAEAAARGYGVTFVTRTLQH